MTRYAGPLLALISAALLCSLPALADDSALHGTWVGPDGATTVIAAKGKKTRVVSIVDDDGEVFRVRGSGSTDGVFSWRYFVPSTKYNLTIVVTEVRPEGLVTLWKNDHDGSGSELLQRKVETP